MQRVTTENKGAQPDAGPHRAAAAGERERAEMGLLPNPQPKASEET